MPRNENNRAREQSAFTSSSPAAIIDSTTVDVYVHPERQRWRSGTTAKVYTQNTEKEGTREKEASARLNTSTQ